MKLETDDGSRDPYVALSDTARHESTLREKQVERGILERASELATWIGTLGDLAEARLPVLVRTGSGRVRRGVLSAVGPDHIVLVHSSAAMMLVVLSSIRLVLPEIETPVTMATGSRPAAGRRTLADVLGRLSEDRSPIAISVADVADPLLGRVLGIGEDVVTLRLARRDRATAYVPVAAIEELHWTPGS